MPDTEEVTDAPAGVAENATSDEQEQIDPWDAAVAAAMREESEEGVPEGEGDEPDPDADEADEGEEGKGEEGADAEEIDEQRIAAIIERHGSDPKKLAAVMAGLQAQAGRHSNEVGKLRKAFREAGGFFDENGDPILPAATAQPGSDPTAADRPPDPTADLKPPTEFRDWAVAEDGADLVDDPDEWAELLAKASDPELSPEERKEQTRQYHELRAEFERDRAEYKQERGRTLDDRLTQAVEAAKAERDQEISRTQEQIRAEFTEAGLPPEFVDALAGEYDQLTKQQIEATVTENASYLQSQGYDPQQARRFAEAYALTPDGYQQTLYAQVAENLPALLKRAYEAGKSGAAQPPAQDSQPATNGNGANGDGNGHAARPAQRIVRVAPVEGGGSRRGGGPVGGGVNLSAEAKAMADDFGFSYEDMAEAIQQHGGGTVRR